MKRRAAASRQAWKEWKNLGSATKLCEFESTAASDAATLMAMKRMQLEEQGHFKLTPQQVAQLQQQKAAAPQLPHEAQQQQQAVKDKPPQKTTEKLPIDKAQLRERKKSVVKGGSGAPIGIHVLPPGDIDDGHGQGCAG